MLERLYECFGAEEKIGLICHMNGMEMGWVNFVIENIYEEVKSEYGEKFVHDKDYIILYKMEEEECF